MKDAKLTKGLEIIEPPPAASGWRRATAFMKRAYFAPVDFVENRMYSPAAAACTLFVIFMPINRYSVLGPLGLDGDSGSGVVNDTVRDYEQCKPSPQEPEDPDEPISRRRRVTGVLATSLSLPRRWPKSPADAVAIAFTCYAENLCNCALGYE